MKVVGKFRKFQEGGAMPEEQALQEQAPQEAPEQGSGQDPMQQILQVAAQAVQSQNCEAAMAVCQALMQLAQGAAGGPEQAPREEPTFARYGAKLVRVRR